MGIGTGVVVVIVMVGGAALNYMIRFISSVSCCDDHSNHAVQPSRYQGDPKPSRVDTDYVMSRTVTFDIYRQQSDDPGKAEICSMCTENFKRGENIVRLQCCHIFHNMPECNLIYTWIRSKDCCPLCNTCV